LSVSVVIPVYNRANTIRDAISSIFIQDIVSEIIIIDDASEDSLIHFLEPYSSRIKYYRCNQNKGVSAARNIGVDIAKSKYIAFLDSDDIFLNKKIEKQLSFMIDNNLKISHSNEFWYRGNRYINQNKNNLRYGGYIFDKVLDKCRVSPSSLMIERELFMSVGGFDESLRVCEDYEFILRVAPFNEIGYIDEKLITKRSITDDQLSSSIEYIESIRLDIIQNFKTKYYNRLSVQDRISLNNEIKRKIDIVKV